jgi:hypothetical protein
VTLSELNAFTIQTKAVVVWSPVLFVRNGRETVATVRVDHSDLRFYTGNEEAFCVARRIFEGDPMKVGRFIAFSRMAYHVFDPAGGKFATIQFASSGTRLEWSVSENGQRRDCTAVEQTSLIGRLLGRKWLKSFAILVDDQAIGSMNERVYPFGQKFAVDLNNDLNHLIDRRVAIALAAVVLLHLSDSLAAPTI